MLTTSVCAMEMSTSAQPAHAEPMTGRKNSPVAVNNIAHIHDIELPPDFDELVYSRRLMLHMLFGADPSTFARIYTAKDAA